MTAICGNIITEIIGKGGRERLSAGVLKNLMTLKSGALKIGNKEVCLAVKQLKYVKVI